VIQQDEAARNDPSGLKPTPLRSVSAAAMAMPIAPPAMTVPVVMVPPKMMMMPMMVVPAVHITASVCPCRNEEASRGNHSDK
jgi:hypothetical protein